MKKLSILLIVSSLNRGGIERQIALLAPELHKRGHSVTISVSRPGDFYEEYLRANNVRIVASQVSAGPPPKNLLARVRHIYRRVRVHAELITKHDFDVVYGFDLTANHYAVLTKVFGRSKVVWGIRNSLPPTSKSALWIERAFSCFVDLTISNSEAGLQVYRAKGISFHQAQVIPNGIDTQRNRVEAQWRNEKRRELSFSKENAVIGSVGRIDDDKDQRTLLLAAEKVVAAHPSTRILIIGEGAEALVTSLKQLAQRLGIKDHVIWSGVVPDVERYLNAMDIFVSASRTEGFPNVIAEAMAVGLPVVVTDVGDSAKIVAGLGRIVPHSCPDRLAAELMIAIKTLQSHRPEPSRQRIVQEYSAQAMIDRTEAALLGLALRNRQEAGSRW